MVRAELRAASRGDGPPGVSHLLVTNDFPPKVGGIQTYLWELWRRLPPDDVARADTPAPGRPSGTPRQALGDPPGPASGCCCRRRRWRAASAPSPAECGGVGWSCSIRRCRSGWSALDLGLPYVGRAPRRRGDRARPAPGTRAAARPQVLRRRAVVIAAGGATRPPRRSGRAGRPLRRCRRWSRPGSTSTASGPLDADARDAARARLGLPDAGPLVVCASRLVPRKGVDVLIEAAARLLPHRPDLTVVIAGAGRDRARLARARRAHAVPVRFLGRVERRRPAPSWTRRRRVRHGVPRPVGRARAGGVRHRLPRGGRVRGAAGRRGAAAGRTRRWSTA